MTNLPTISTARDVELAALAASAQGYADESLSGATKRAYASDWRAFTAWCEVNTLTPMPATSEAVALYLAAEADAGRKAATITRRAAAIATVHRLAGLANPSDSAEVRAVLRGIRRRHGTAPASRDALTVGELRAMVGACPDTLIGRRDRALLLVGFAGAFRRSEAVAIDVEDLRMAPDGIVVNVRKSKTDQLQAGEQVGLPYANDPAVCPVLALRRWLEDAGITEGAAFRPVDRHGNIGERLTPQAVARVVKQRASEVGINPARLAGHSLRSGLATAAAAAGVPERQVMAQGRWKSATTARKYVRHGSIWLDAVRVL